MREKLAALYELQKIDLELAKAQKAKASLDDGVAKKQQVEVARQEVEKADRLFHEVSAEMHDKDLNLKTVESKQKMFRDKLYAGTVTNPKELSSMEKEIEMLGRQKDKLEERILELLDLVEERKSAQAAAKETLKQQEDELAVYMEKLRQEEASLAGKIKELTPRREAVLTAVDTVLLKRYEAMRTHLGGVVIGRVDGNSCSACHTQIPSDTMRDLKADAEMQTCDNCGRLLCMEQI